MKTINVKNQLFFTVLVVFLFLMLSASAAFAGDSPSLHTVTTGLPADYDGQPAVTFFKEKIFVAYPFNNEIRIARFNLKGDLEATYQLKGSSQAAVGPKVRISSDANTLAIIWSEEENSTGELWIATTSDGSSFLTKNIDNAGVSGSYPDYDISVSGTTITVIYGKKSVNYRGVYAKVSGNSGQSFSESSAFSSDNPNERLWFLDLDMLSSGKTGAAIVFRKEVNPDTGYTEDRIFYLESSNFGNSWSAATMVFNDQAKIPDVYSVWRPLSFSFDKNGNSWIAWCSKDDMTIYYLIKTSSTWSSPKTFSSSNTMTSSLSLLRNEALFGDGLMLVYSKGSSSSIFYRQAKNLSLVTERQFSSSVAGKKAYVSACEFFGHTAFAVIYANLDNLEVWYENILVPGRTGKLRYRLWSENFENSDVLNDTYWRVTTDATSANAYWKETTNYKYEGMKSLWCAGFGSSGGEYVPNMATNAEIALDLDTTLTAEMNFNYIYLDGGGSSSLAGFNSRWTDFLLPTDSVTTWLEKFVLEQDLKGTNRAGFRFLSDLYTTVTALGTFIDAFNVYGYKLKRFDFNITEEPGKAFIITVSNYESDKTYHLYAKKPGQSSFSKVATFSTNSYRYRVYESGNYSFYIIADDGEFESPPSQIWMSSIQVDPNWIYPRITIEGVSNNAFYNISKSATVTIEHDELVDYYVKVNNVAVSPSYATETTCIYLLNFENEGNYVITAYAKNVGNKEVTTLASFTIDKTPPVIDKTPTLSTPTYSYSKTFKLTFSSTDNLSGIKEYEVYYKVGASGTFKLYKKTTSTSLYFTGTPGYTYYFKVLAVDRAGNRSAYSTVKATVIPYDQGIFRYSGRWYNAYNSNYFFGSERRSSTKGSYAYTQTLYSVREITLLTTKHRYAGKAKVYINGVLIKTVDLYSYTTKYRQPVVIATYSSPKTVKVKVVVTGTKNYYSKGYTVGIDGLIVRR